MDLKKLKITDIKKGLENKDFSSVELTNQFLELARETDKEISSLLEITDDLALEQAKKVDEEQLKSLSGVPIIIKDNILVKDVKSTAGSKILEYFRAPTDATVIKKIKDAGAIILGKGNMDEFAMGGSTENSAFFNTKNPVDTDKVPGGSSGGPAAAVAAGIAPISLGSDTGGSIRQPASFCGVVGFKPSYGRVSRNGLMAMASSLDQIGPFAKSVQDAKKVFNVIKGRDDKDATSLKIEDNPQDIDKFKVGVPKEYFVDGVDEKVKEEVQRSIDKIKDSGVEVVDISLPHTEYALACYQIVMASEVSANMARYDGIRYGLETDRPEAKSIEDAYRKNRGKLGDEVKRRIILGTYCLSSGYYDDYYMKAEKVRELIRRDFEDAFEKVDVIVTPTSPVLPFNIGEKVENPLSMYLADTFTTPANLAGLPAISIPSGAEGLPVGVQLMGERFEDEKLLSIAEKIEEII
ncbi:MAG: Asp-tRNA(Asn)/Glu-tRNA(Gln) amidotransferase subunit GatA [Patescibacteria group bacterium]